VLTNKWASSTTVPTPMSPWTLALTQSAEQRAALRTKALSQTIFWTVYSNAWRVDVGLKSKFHHAVLSMLLEHQRVKTEVHRSLCLRVFHSFACLLSTLCFLLGRFSGSCPNQHLPKLSDASWLWIITMKLDLHIVI
jgi:hypothetical protein